MRFMLFTADVDLAAKAAAAGVDRIVIDLERSDKRERQHGYHLECGGDTLDDLRRMRRAVDVEIVCRVNPVHAHTPKEVDDVLAAGADVVMLPMFRTPGEVDAFLEAVGGRAVTSLLFETRESIASASAMPRGFDEVYVGLNDLALASERPFCYQLVADGTVDGLRRIFPDRPFGFGGVTVEGCGAPLSTRHILSELGRLGATDVILRRAFKRDIQGRDMALEVQRLRDLGAALENRPPSAIDADRTAFCETVAAIAADAAGDGDRTAPAVPARRDRRRVSPRNGRPPSW